MTFTTLFTFFLTSSLFALTASSITHRNFTKISWLTDKTVTASSLVSRQYLNINGTMRCAAKCVRDGNCAAFTFNSYHRNCLLLSRIPTANDVQNNTGWMYYKDQEICNTQLGYTLNQSLCFKLYNTTLPKNEAVLHCQREGASLLRIQDAERQNIIADYLTFINFTDYVFLDGQRDNLTSNWTWSDDSTLTYFSWDSSANLSTNKHCIKLLPAAQYNWKTAYCTHAKAFICQIDIH